MLEMAFLLNALCVVVAVFIIVLYEYKFIDSQRSVRIVKISTLAVAALSIISFINQFN